MKNLKTLIKNKIKNFLWKFFQIFQKFKIDFLPRHFYSEIPNISNLRSEKAWRKKFEMKSVNGADVSDHFDLLKKWLGEPIGGELEFRNVHLEACRINGTDGYGLVEAQVLFGFVAKEKPFEIFQIGCGVSTAICLMAAEFADYVPQVTCVEPYPSDYLIRMENESRIRLIRKKAQELELSDVEKISPHALFFVDSTHTLGPAGEVTRIILEMLPRLKKGCAVHFHDILFPYDYPRDLLNGALFFPHESPLLHAFLCGNSRFQILCSLSMLHYQKKQELQRLIPSYLPAGDEEGLQTTPGHFPSATYLKVV
jgi:hypothetical protein